MYALARSALASAGVQVPKAHQRPSSQVLVAYALFLGIAGVVYHFVAEGEISVVMTLAYLVQCLALVLLLLQVTTSGSAAGISARALAMEALSLCCRLSSTLWLHGYLPSDATGDGLVQAVDLCSLALVLALLYQVLHVKRRTYEEQEDAMSVVPMTLGCFLGGALLHADMNHRPVFDALWMTGLFLGVMAVLPQLWLIARTGGRVEALTSHYVAMMALSRILGGLFMWEARFDVQCTPWAWDFEHAIWAILGAHAVHLLLLADFGYHYLRSRARDGLAGAMVVDLV